MEAAGQQLLDFNQQFDVGLLDKVVQAAYDPHNQQVRGAASSRGDAH